MLDQTADEVSMDADAQQDSDAAERAASYDDDVRAAIPGYELLHETAAALLHNALSERARLLLVGVGTGEEILRLAPGHPGWRFTAVDPASTMLDVARTKVDTAALNDRVEFRVGGVDDVPATEQFDAATLILVQHFLPDDGSKLAMLRAIADRLEPGGLLFLANMHGDLASPASQRLFQAWKQRQLARGLSSEDADAMFAGLPQVIHFVTEDRIEELL